MSGALAPGPMTTAAIGWGSRFRHAGLWMALGHAVVEFPLMILLVAGMGEIFKLSGVKRTIALTGSVVLLWMAWGMLRSKPVDTEIEAETDADTHVNLNSNPDADTKTKTLIRNQSGRLKGPFWTGVLFSAGNPYFLLWWAVIGLSLAMQARQMGIWIFISFAILHWLCDLVWLEMLSWGSYKGSRIWAQKGEIIVMRICGLALILFAGKFIYDGLS